MSKFLMALVLSVIAVTGVEARCCNTNVSIGIGIASVQPVYVARSYPYRTGYYGCCRRYAGRIPPVYAYPHTVYRGPPGIIYEEIYPYPPCCGGWYY